MSLRKTALWMLGCLLAAAVAWCAYGFVKYPQRSVVEMDSTCVPYVVQGDAEAQRLAKPAYWVERESEVRLAAQEWCRQEGISAELEVVCVGSVANCFFSVEYEGWMSKRQRQRLDAFLKEEIETVYDDVSLTRDRIFSRWMRANL